MREASNEKDLKRLLQNVQLQLDAIKRGYGTFKESQFELIKQYPQMIKEVMKFLKTLATIITLQQLRKSICFRIKIFVNCKLSS